MTQGAPDERLIEWTGERCVPWVEDYQVIYEHYHRYALALAHAEDKRVLDLASGEGYGAALLASRAAEVVGVDVDTRTVEHARARYSSENLRFVVGSITDPDLLAGEPLFDVVTCFEAVEHVEEQDELLRLIRARLAPDGVLLCSTPDVEVYTHEHGNDNPYHVRELTEDGFRALLESTFEHVRMLRQNVAVGSLMHDGPGGGGTETYTLQRIERGAGPESEDGAEGIGTADSERRWTVAPGTAHTYLLGIASARPPAVPDMSVLVDPDLTLVERHGSSELAELRSGTAVLRQQLTDTEQAFAREQDAAQRHAAERDETLVRAGRAEQAYRDAAEENERLRGRLERALARLDWSTSNNSGLRETLGALAAENAALKAQQSATAQRLIGRYRRTVERVAPRGTRLRDAYEAALGRPTGPAPAAVDTSPVAVTTSERPIVSVVLPTYGQWPYTRHCLASIQRNLPTTPFEVIVVDDASPDDSAERVAACAGVRLVRAEHNRGFIGACNLGAQHARGEFVLFLNNDTEVHHGWLDESVSVLDECGDVGLVGSKLVYPDGTLQECGGIVWADGSGWNYGRGSPAEEPRFATLRDVDYCSGAALLVRKEVFDAVGGFDTRFAPAYYEDTDLAFAVRAAGYRTVVQPTSVVTHYEGVSNGTDGDSGVKRHQELNRTVFAEKWADALADHLEEASPRNVWVGRTRTARGHRGGFVLVADHQVPRPDEDSGSVRITRLLELLVGLQRRVVFFVGNGALPPEYTQALHQAGVTVIADLGQQEEFLRDVGPELRLAVLSRPQVAWQWLERLREHAPDCVVAYDTVDLHFLRLSRQAELAGELGDTAARTSLEHRSRALRELELGLTRACDVTLTVSDTERDLLADVVPSARVEVLSNVHEIDPVPALPAGRADILFVGSFNHRPNRDGVRWLAEEVMPLVRKRHPDAVAHVVGSTPPPDMLELHSDGVMVHGWVRDLTAMYRSARVVTAPLRFGAGVKGKVGESLAHGVPVVATTLAVEGMHLTDGTEVLVGDTAESLAEGIATLLTDDALWSRVSDAGKVAVEARFGPEVARKTLSTLLPPRPDAQ